MTWLYILIDVLILIFVLALILVVLYFWNKKKELNIGSLSEFRNNTIYEKSYEDQKKKAHIEEIIEEETAEECADAILRLWREKNENT